MKHSRRGHWGLLIGVAIVAVAVILFLFRDQITSSSFLIDGSRTSSATRAGNGGVVDGSEDVSVKDPVVSKPLQLQKDVTEEASVDESEKQSASTSAIDDRAADPKSEDGAQTDASDAVAQTPRFDVVGVEPTGETVVAGRSEPGAIVALLANGRVVGKDVANASGEFAIILEEALKPGDYDVSLESRADENAAPRRSTQSASVSISSEKDEAPLVVVNTPGEASRVLQKPQTITALEEDGGVDEKPVAMAAADAMVDDGAGKGEASSASTSMEQDSSAGREGRAVANTGSEEAASQTPAPKVSVEAVEAEKDQLFVAGAGEPEKDVRVYVDDKLVGQTKAGDDGRWLLETKKKIAPGEIDVRADQLSDEQGKVDARAQVTFSRADDEVILRPVSLRSSGSGTTGPSGQVSAAAPSMIIRKGDNLWTISRRLYGDGVRYTSIYQANLEQIRDPDLIYPGQVFVLPVGDKSWTNPEN